MPYTDIGSFNPYNDPYYNAKVHGPFYPWRDYRVPKRPSFWSMKLGEIWPYYLQSDCSKANIKYVGRLALWNWRYKRSVVSKNSLKPVMQLLIVIGMVNLVMNYKFKVAERRVKYHW